ncbi:hypothetical protein D3C85_1805050 [compost metagenome]
MPSSARRTANKREAMDKPALEMPYSPRKVETACTLEEVMVMMQRCCSHGVCRRKRRAKAWVRKNVPRVFT